MIFFKKYTTIPNLLKRFTILKFWKIHIRLHRFIGQDTTQLLHNHPFNYLSIVLKGGYIERIGFQNPIFKQYNFLSFIWHKSKRFHKIEYVEPNTLTLFISFGKYKWNAINLSNSDTTGIFERSVNGKTVWSKIHQGIWYIGNVDKQIAQEETRHSVNQTSEKIKNGNRVHN